jgi:hypothetical protein
MIDYSLILTVNYFGNEWALSANDYDTLQWFSTNPKPTKAELDALAQSTQDTVARNACKAQAKALLSASDWASLSDVDLTNKADFIAYRSTLRNLALNPVENPTFPTEPTPVWS